MCRRARSCRFNSVFDEPFVNRGHVIVGSDAHVEFGGHLEMRNSTIPSD